MVPAVKAPKPAARRPHPRRPNAVPDLQSQFEDLLNQVWASEADWRFDDRIDLALKIRRA